MSDSGETYFVTRDGTRLYWRMWLPDNKAPQQCANGILLMHGLGEHCGRYTAMGHWLSDAGYAVMGFDHFGHGKSTGGRGAQASYSDQEQDYAGHAVQVLDFFSDLLGKKPIVLGHSLGGLIAAETVLGRQAPAKALVLSSPALGLHLSKTQHRLLSVMTLLAPNLGVPNGIDANGISHDAEVVAKYRNDPLVHNKITPNTLRWMLSTADRLTQLPVGLPVPTLLMPAMQDRLVNAQASAMFAQHHAGKMLAHEPLHDSFHEIFNEEPTRRNLAYKILADWLNDRLNDLPTTNT